MNEVNRVLCFLASFPGGNSTVTTKDLKELLLTTGGTLFCNGDLRKIRSERLGAGVSKVWTVRSEP